MQTNQRATIQIHYRLHLIQSTDGPFQADTIQASKAIQFFQRTVGFCWCAFSSIQDNIVPIVGSFSVVHDLLKSFTNRFTVSRAISTKRRFLFLSQWWPPFRWYISVWFSPTGRRHSPRVLKLLRRINYNLAWMSPLVYGVSSVFFWFSKLLRLSQRLSGHYSGMCTLQMLRDDGWGLPFWWGRLEKYAGNRSSMVLDCMSDLKVWLRDLDEGGVCKALLNKYSELFDWLTPGPACHWGQQARWSSSGSDLFGGRMDSSIVGSQRISNQNWRLQHLIFWTRVKLVNIHIDEPLFTWNDATKSIHLRHIYHFCCRESFCCGFHLFIGKLAGHYLRYSECAGGYKAHCARGWFFAFRSGIFWFAEPNTLLSEDACLTANPLRNIQHLLAHVMVRIVSRDLIIFIASGSALLFNHEGPFEVAISVVTA